VNPRNVHETSIVPEEGDEITASSTRLECYIRLREGPRYAAGTKAKP
jgi:hypothetical protein